MKPVAIARTNALVPDQHWSLSLSELFLAAAAPVTAGQDVDALFCAAPSAAFAQGQCDIAAIVADRLSIAPKIVQSLDAGDASAAAALNAACQYLSAGVARVAVVAGAAKVSDLAEAERFALLDRTLDQEAEVLAGVSFASQAGLLAGHYCRAAKENAELLAQVTMSNLAAWAKGTSRPTLSSAELRRDLLVAPPLVRTDFAQLLDGACAILLVAGGEDAPWTIDAFGAGVDTVAVWERKDPLAFLAVERALAAMQPAPSPQWLEIDSAVSIAQRLAEDAIGRVTGKTPHLVNLRGGAQGRGRVWGVSLLYQINDIVECDAPFPSVLATSVGGLGSRAFTARLGKSAP